MPVIDPSGALCQVGTEYAVTGAVNNADGTDQRQFSFAVSLLGATGPATNIVMPIIDGAPAPVSFDGAMKAMIDAFYTYMADNLPTGYGFEPGSPNVTKEIIGDVASDPAWTYTHP